MNNYETQLQAATKRRAQVVSKIERLRGRLEEAEANLETVESEIRAKKIQPEQLDETILKLEERFAKELEKLEDAISNAESSLEPYETGDNQ